MCENAYLSIKNPKAPRALKRALDPGRRMLTSLRQQLSASEARAPPLTKSWIRTWRIQDFLEDRGHNPGVCVCVTGGCQPII